MDPDEKLTKRARNTAYRHLTIRPRSRAEVEKKLHDRSFPADIVHSVIDHLLRLGYLNDALFARQWAASRVRSRGFGRRRIEQELRLKGISRDIVRDTLAGLFKDASELEVARKEAEKKLKTLARIVPEVRKRRLAGFLERRGFTADIIRSVLRSLPA